MRASRQEPRRAAAAVVLALTVAIGCDAPDRGPRWRPAGARSPRDGGALRFAAKDGVRTLDPTLAYDEVSLYVLHPMLDTLVDYEPAGTRLIPRLAARWDVSPDGLIYRFWLRDGLRYSDGRAIVAADVASSLTRALALPSSPFGSYLADVVGAAAVTAGEARACAGITAVGDRELEIRLAHPNAAFLYVLAMAFTAPMPADRVAALGDRMGRAPPTSGPYALVAWDEGQRVVLRKNPYYFDPDRQHLDQLVMLENVPRDSQFLMFERGELDTAERLTSPDYLWLIDQPAWQPYVHDQPALNSFGARMNVRVKPFDDRRVRQALNYALDKRHTAKLLNGGMVASHGVLAPGTFGRDAALVPYPHDPAKARALLADAGYPDGLVVDYVALGDEEAEKVAAALQSDLGAVGVTVNISLMSFATYATAIGKPDGPAFSLGGWTGDFPDPTSFLDPLFHSRAISAENSTNSTFYANPALDRLLDAARVEGDVDRRAAMYRHAERILYDDAPWIWNYHRVMTEVTQPYVRGYVPHPIWARDYTSAWLDLGPDGAPVPR